MPHWKSLLIMAVVALVAVWLSNNVGFVARLVGPRVTTR